MLITLTALTTLISTAQKTDRRGSQLGTTEHQRRIEQKMSIAATGRPAIAAPVQANNDLGISNAAALQGRGATPSPSEAICATFTGSLGPGDLTTTNRLNRNGVQGVCPGPKPLAAPLTGNSYYDVHTWTNNSGLTQCATFSLSTTDATTNIEFGVWNGSFNNASYGTNFFTDPGLSSGTPPTVTTCSANVAAGQTLVFVIFTPNAALQTASDYTLTVDMPICSSVPCSATPAPGNTLSTVSTVCPGISFTLSLQNSTSGSGVTYQWQSAPATSGPWTNIAGATGSTLTTTQSAATCYQCIVTCAGNGSATSTPVCVALTPPSGCYCIPGATDCTDDDVITRVRISTLDNASTCGTGPPAGYTNYTTTVAAPTVFAGATNPITIDKPTSFTEGLQVWIDYNQNGNFEAAELTTIGTVGNLPSVTGPINIPSSALTGTTRMRVRIRFAAVPGDPCLGYAFGETEDYSVNIQPCVPVTVTGSPSNVSIACGANASFTVTTAGSLPSFVWEYRVNASSPWQFVPNAAPFSGINSATLTMTNVPVTYNGYQFRAVLTGGCSATDFSGAATLTVTPVVPVVSPASATICTGSVQQLTLTNTLGNTDLLNEGFESTSLPAGWNMQNLSTPIGTNPTWIFNTATVHSPAQNGTPNSYAFANFNNVAGDNTISNWLITPALPIKNGDVFSFWTRTVGAPAFPDRLEVRMNSTNTTNVGATNTSVGDFTNLLLTVNPTLTTSGYPTAWTQFTVTVSGLASPTAAGRFAFRYFVTSGGPLGANSDAIGVDNVKFTSAGGPAQGIWTGPANTIFTNSGGTTPYVAGTPATTVYVAPTAAGVNNYQVSFTTPTPCVSTTTTVPVTVVIPAAVTTQPANTTVCDGGTATFTVAGSGGPITYQWQSSTDGGLTYTNISGATGTTLTVSNVTLSMTGYRYRAVLSAAPCAGSVNSNAATLTVNPRPVVTLTATDLSLIPGQITTITASSTPAAATYAWTLNGSPIAGTGNSQTVGIDQVGTYTATATTAGPPACTSATAASITIGAEASDRLWIYPNPNTGTFQVRLYFISTDPTNKRAVYIYNEAGQLVTSREYDMGIITPAYMRMDFQLGAIAKGTYVVKVVDKYTGKITSGLVVLQ